MTEKIRTDHRERAAYVYVRQSSLQQVRHHREGQQRQYGRADRARQLGFARVVVVRWPCPSNRCIVWRSTPASSKCVAKQWRNAS